MEGFMNSKNVKESYLGKKEDMKLKQPKLKGKEGDFVEAYEYLNKELK